MSQNLNRRIGDLEERILPDEPIAFIVYWGEDPEEVYLMAGGKTEKMTYQEYCERFPDHQTKVLTWEDVCHERPNETD